MLHTYGSCLAIRLKDDKRRYDVLLLCNNIFSSSSSALIWQNANGRRFQKSHCSLVANSFSQFNGFLGLVFFFFRKIVPTFSGVCSFVRVFLWCVFMPAFPLFVWVTSTITKQLAMSIITVLVLLFAQLKTGGWYTPPLHTKTWNCRIWYDNGGFVRHKPHPLYWGFLI